MLKAGYVFIFGFKSFFYILKASYLLISGFNANIYPGNPARHTPARAKHPAQFPPTANSPFEGG